MLNLVASVCQFCFLFTFQKEPRFFVSGRRDMNEPSPSDEERPFYFTRAALEKYHSRLFSGEPSFSVAGFFYFSRFSGLDPLDIDRLSERPISETSKGLVDAVLRVPANYPEKEECLRTCLLQLASTYSVNNNWNFLGEEIVHPPKKLFSYTLFFQSPSRETPF